MTRSGGTIRTRAEFPARATRRKPIAHSNDHPARGAAPHPAEHPAGGGPDDAPRGTDAINPPQDRGPVEDIVARLDDTAQSERVTLGDVVEAFGQRSFLPMLMVPALLVLSPLSGIPLFSSICGITIALISAQMLWPGRDCLWLPDRLTRQNISGERARKAVARLGRTARWLDRNARQRFGLLVRRSAGQKLLQLCCFLAGATMPIFELVPFTSSILGFAVLLMATGLLTRDGLFAVAGLAVLVIAPMVPFLIVDGIVGGPDGVTTG